jgi:hypothetical protein
VLPEDQQFVLAVRISPQAVSAKQQPSKSPDRAKTLTGCGIPFSLPGIFEPDRKRDVGDRDVTPLPRDVISDFSRVAGDKRHT